MSAITRGKTSSGTGFIEMKLNVPEGRTIGAIEFEEVPGSRFQLRVVHKGQINSLNFVPIPTNIPPGQPFEVTVHGVDLGDGPNVSQLNCHTITLGSRVNTAFTARLTKTGGCSPLGPFSFTVRSSAQSDPEVYATSQGAKSFPFGPYVGCVAEPALGAPVVISPNHNQVFLFLPVADTAISESFRRPGTYHVAIRAKNCGTLALTTTIRFELR